MFDNLTNYVLGSILVTLSVIYALGFINAITS